MAPVLTCSVPSIEIWSPSGPPCRRLILIDGVKYSSIVPTLVAATVWISGLMVRLHSLAYVPVSLWIACIISSYLVVFTRWLAERCAAVPVRFSTVWGTMLKPFLQ